MSSWRFFRPCGVVHVIGEGRGDRATHGRREMIPSEVRAVLTANEGRRVRVTFADGMVQSVDVHSVDDEGFLHSGPDGIDPASYWTRFESVTLVEPDPATFR